MAIINFQQATRRMQPARTPSAARITALIAPWLASRAADGCRPRGVATYRAKLGQFVDFAGDIAAARIDARLIEAYKIHLHERDLEASTVRHMLTVVRAFCAYLVREEILSENVALKVKHPRVEAPDPDPLIREQIDVLLAICDRPPRSHKDTWRRNRRAVFLMLYAGLRIAEVSELEWRDVDLARGELIVRRAGGKGGKSRVVPVCDELSAELCAAGARPPHGAVVDQGDKHPGVRLTIKSTAHIFERWLLSRGMKIHPHQLRKTFATELYIAGEDLATIQRLLGHADPKTTLRYLGASAAKERSAVQKLRFRST